MRLRTLVAVVVLLGLAGLVAFFLLGPRADEQRAYAPRKLAPEVSARMEADARKKLAFESLTERLPKGKPVSPTRPIGPEAKERWERLDNELATWQMPRAKLLQELHEKTRKFFVESPGEGAMRRQLTPEEILLDEFNGAAGTTDQPGEQADFPLSPGEPLSRVEPNRDFYHYHSDGVSNFLYPRGFGHVQDRAHVAGFKSHGFRSDAYPAWRVENWSWRFQYIQLVGILSHETPVVYLTDQLPSMEQVRQGKTRPLDLFEEAALPALREGEDLFLASKGENVRMMGALRATKTCQQCHDAEVGDLLGAFTYTLRRAPGGK
ncbi:MAG TPA: hypothetical protein VKD71_01680 [Gemmataceae bacterium]|nr:hypothetical protein [Gemmataceae bacterium]